MKGVEMPEEISSLIADLQRDRALEIVKKRLEEGDDPLRLLDECRGGMTIVGDRFQKGDYFLAELMLSAEIFKTAVSTLRPYLARVRPSKPLGRVILATMQGDIHDLGKNILATLLEASGFEVQDLGVDVPPERLVSNVRDTHPDFVGFSALITTTFDSMKQAVDMLSEAGLRNQIKLMVGGGVTTPMVRDYIGADFQTTDAMEGVEYCLKAIGG